MNFSYQFQQSLFSLVIQINHDHEEMSYGNQFFYGYWWAQRRSRNGSPQIRTEWNSITLFDRLSVIASQYLSKGRLVLIDGSIQSRKYSGKDGIERIAYDTMVVKWKCWIAIMKRLQWAVMVILQLNRIIRHYLQQALRFRVQNLQQHSSMISMTISRFRGKQQKFKFKYLTLALELGAGIGSSHNKNVNLLHSKQYKKFI